MNQINFRATDEELERLKKYCEINRRQKSEVLRELIRNLKLEKSRPKTTGF